MSQDIMGSVNFSMLKPRSCPPSIYCSFLICCPVCKQPNQIKLCVGAEPLEGGIVIYNLAMINDALKEPCACKCGVSFALNSETIARIRGFALKHFPKEQVRVGA